MNTRDLLPTVYCQLRAYITTIWWIVICPSHNHREHRARWIELLITTPFSTPSTLSLRRHNFSLLFLPVQCRMHTNTMRHGQKVCATVIFMCTAISRPSLCPILYFMPVVSCSHLTNPTRPSLALFVAFKQWELPKNVRKIAFIFHKFRK